MLVKFHPCLNMKITKLFDGNMLTKPLYHYTDSTAFHSILKNRTIWLTNYRYLNDPSERNYGYDLIIEYLDNYLTKNEIPKIKEFYNFFSLHHDNISQSFERDFYLASMTEDGDSLDQWRSYGNDGKGFAIEYTFKQDTLPKEVNINSHIGPILMKVIYDKEEQLSIVEGFVDEYLNSDVDLFVFKYILEILCFKFKNFHYRNEKEWRLLFSPIIMAGFGNKHVLYRENETEFIPYIQFLLPNITGAYIGPCRNKGNTIIIIEMFQQLLKNKDANESIRNFNIKFSSVPYRS